MRMEWSYLYRIEVPELDNQHIKLFDLINDLMDGIEGNSREEATRVALTSLLQYAQEHFTAEERLMKDVAYPGYDGQKAEHVKFVKKMNELAARVGTDFDAAGEELMAYTMGWLQTHILDMDAKIGVFIKEKKERR